MTELSWQIQKSLKSQTACKCMAAVRAAPHEVIAAAFVLNRMEFLPSGYTDVVEAWERLGSEWQGYVMLIKGTYMHLIREAP